MLPNGTVRVRNMPGNLTKDEVAIRKIGELLEFLVEGQARLSEGLGRVEAAMVETAREVALLRTALTEEAAARKGIGITVIDHEATISQLRGRNGAR